MEQQKEVLALLEQYEQVKSKEESQKEFIPFVRAMWSEFIGGEHHEIMAEAFEKVANGELKRLIINMPPRHTKSEFASYLFPAWFLGQYPEKSHPDSPHSGVGSWFGRKVRNLIQSEEYQKVFSGIELSTDGKSCR